MKNYAWRLPSGDWFCSKKNNERNTKIPSTPYVNKALFSPSIESAKFNMPKVDFPLELHEITVNSEAVFVYEPPKPEKCDKCGTII